LDVRPHAVDKQGILGITSVALPLGSRAAAPSVMVLPRLSPGIGLNR